MPNCRNCGAPIPLKTTVCSYCNSRNDVDLSMVRSVSVNSKQENRSCPRCNCIMLTLDLSGNGLFLIERCEKCYGLFFDIGELEKYIQISNVSTSEIDYHLLNSLLNENHHTDNPVQYLKCPVCAQLMNRINYGRKSGVVINKCTSHGIWLDSGQLNHILGWVKSGGFELDRICKEEEREELLSEHHSEQVFSTYSYANRACEINVSDLVKIVKRFLFG